MSPIAWCCSSSSIDYSIVCLTTPLVHTLEYSLFGLPLPNDHRRKLRVFCLFGCSKLLHHVRLVLPVENVHDCLCDRILLHLPGSYRLLLSVSLLLSEAGQVLFGQPLSSTRIPLADDLSLCFQAIPQRSHSCIPL